MVLAEFPLSAAPLHYKYIDSETYMDSIQLLCDQERPSEAYFSIPMDKKVYQTIPWQICNRVAMGIGKILTYS